MVRPLTLSTVALSAALLAGCSMFGSAPKTSTPTRAADGTLIGPEGRTLYVFTKDMAGSGTSACYSQCATNWPPLTVAPAAQPTGDYTIIARTDNTRQWAYKGQPLYYFAKDSKPGDKLGDGMAGGLWKVVRP
ncbi:MAG: ATP-binding protein [Comamonas sp.]